MYREPSRLPRRLNPARTTVSRKGLTSALKSAERAAKKDPEAVRKILDEVGRPSRKAVVASGRVSSAPRSHSKETSVMKKAKGKGKGAGTHKAGKGKGRSRKARAKTAAPATAVHETKKRRRRRTPKATTSKKRLVGVRRAVVRAARAIAPKKLHTVKRKNLKRGNYMDTKGRWRKVNPTTDTKLMIAKVASFGVGLLVAEGVDRYIATRKTDKHDILYGATAIRAFRSKPDGVRLFAQAAGAGVFGVGAYLLRKKSAYATSIMGGFAAAFAVKLFMQVAFEHALPALLKAEKADETTYANRLLADKQPYADQSAEGFVARPARPFQGNPAHPAGSVGTVRVPLSLGEVFPGAVGCGACAKCGSHKPCSCQGASCGNTRVPIGLQYGGQPLGEVDQTEQPGSGTPAQPQGPVTGTPAYPQGPGRFGPFAPTATTLPTFTRSPFVNRFRAANQRPKYFIA